MSQSDSQIRSFLGLFVMAVTCAFNSSPLVGQDVKTPQSTPTRELLADFKQSLDALRIKYGNERFMLSWTKENFILDALFRCESRCRIPSTVRSVDRGILRNNGSFVLEAMVDSAQDQVIPAENSFWMQGPCDIHFSRIDAVSEGSKAVSPAANDSFRVLASTGNFLTVVQCTEATGKEGIAVATTAKAEDYSHPAMNREFYDEWLKLSETCLSDSNASEDDIEAFLGLSKRTKMVPVWVDDGQLRFPNRCRVTITASGEFVFLSGGKQQELRRSRLQMYYPAKDSQWVEITEKQALPCEVDTYVMFVRLGTLTRLLVFSIDCPLPVVIAPTDFVAK